MVAPKGPGSVKAGIKFLQGYHIRISSDCKLLIHEAKNYRHKVDKATGRKLLELAQTGHDHGWDAVRYALWDYIKLQNGGVFMRTLPRSKLTDEQPNLPETKAETAFV